VHAPDETKMTRAVAQESFDLHLFTGFSSSLSTGETKTTPKGSNIHSEMMFQPQFARTELENFKRRLQFKNGTRANLVMEEAFKDLERKEKMKDFMVDQRGKRDLAQFKSRGCR